MLRLLKLSLLDTRKRRYRSNPLSTVHPYDKNTKSPRRPGKATPTLYRGVQLGPFKGSPMNGSLAALCGDNY